MSTKTVAVDLENRRIDVVEGYEGSTEISVGSTSGAVGAGVVDAVVITVGAAPAQPRVRARSPLTAMQLVALAALLGVNVFGVDEER